MSKYAVPVLLGSMVALSCISARAADQVELIEQMNTLEASTSLDSPDLKPWHLRATYDILDSAGKTTDHGTIEEWWAGPKLWRRVISGTDYVGTELRNADGRFRSEDQRSVPTLANMVLRQIVHPAPTLAEIKQATLESQTVAFGKVNLQCVMVGAPVKNVAHPPAGLFPTYCFEPGKPVFRASYNFGGVLSVRNGIGKFQNRYTATSLVFSEANHPVLRAKVEVLETATLTAENFVPGPELVPAQAEIVRVGSSVIAGRILQQTRPEYPASARQAHITGSVVLAAVIGQDGHIFDLRVVSTPDVSLAIASLAAVRQWTYTPYVLNGRPVEVQTTVTVNFAMGF